MFCYKCGKENKKDSKFCVSCGEKLESVEIDNSSCETTIESKSTIEELKKFLLSPLVIIAISLFTVFIVSSILGAGNVIYDIADKIEDFAYSFDLDINFGPELDFINVIFKIVAIIFMIPNIIICVGLWITLSSKTITGIKMIKVVNLIVLIFTSVFLVLSLVSTIAVIDTVISFTEQTSDVDVNNPTSATPLNFILTLLLPFILFRFLCLFKINSTLKRFVQSVKNNCAFSGASKFLAVILIISGVFECFLGMIGINSLPMLCSAGTSICFAVIIFKFNTLCLNKLNEI